MTTTKKRNPQDATLRNIRALKARVEKLEKFADDVEEAFRIVEKLLQELNARSAAHSDDVMTGLDARNTADRARQFDEL